MDNSFTSTTCLTSQDCYPNAFCDFTSDKLIGYCHCDVCYVNDPNDDTICTIKLIPILTAFLISLFVGSCGVDHCLISGCTCPGICIGIVKAITLGGLGIWWIIDIVFIGTGSLNDYYNIKGYEPLCNEWVVN